MMKIRTTRQQKLIALTKLSSRARSVRSRDEKVDTQTASVKAVSVSSRVQKPVSKKLAKSKVTAKGKKAVVKQKVTALAKMSISDACKSDPYKFDSSSSESEDKHVRSSGGSGRKRSLEWHTTTPSRYAYEFFSGSKPKRTPARPHGSSLSGTGLVLENNDVNAVVSQATSDSNHSVLADRINLESTDSLKKNLINAFADESGVGSLKSSFSLKGLENSPLVLPGCDNSSTKPKVAAQ